LPSKENLIQQWLYVAAKERGVIKTMSLEKIDITQNKEHFARITEDRLDALRERIGIKIEKTADPWVTELNVDAIRHYAWGIGDNNPLWLDPEYAAKTRFGGIIAPPSILYATNRVVGGYCGGLPGVHAMFAGTNWTWLKPLPINTKINVEVYLKNLIEHETRFAGRSIQQIYHGDFFNPEGDKLAEADSWVFRTERETARKRSEKYDREKKRKVYTDEEIARVHAMYENEEVRGATPRYWEDVQVGDDLPPIVKGPMTITGFIAFVQGWGGLYVRAHKIAFEMFRKHFGLAIPNSYNIPDVPERVHWEEELAKAVGTPGAYDYGPERISWMSHMMTNWIGDNGFLHKLDAKVVRHNPEGDVIVINGKVTQKYKEGDNYCVDCDLLATQQDGEKSCVATATAYLPSRQKK
jgi:acyl dehydratase